MTPKVAGKIEKILVKESDFVKAGDVLLGVAYGNGFLEVTK